MGCEFILYFKRGRRPPSSGVARTNLIFNTPQIRPAKLIHPHEKPEALLRQLMNHSTDKGDLLVDPFGGSGSLARAARAAGRSAISIELEEFNYQTAKKALDEAEQALF
jgi:DNA modification methylase